jgi:gluconolactonase
LFFTDPPYGLPRGDDDPAKELPFNGVFKLSDGKLDVIIKDLTRPNGIAFSPDEKILYVSNSDDNRRVWLRYDVASNGTVTGGRVFFDATAEKAAGVPDGMKIDVRGNIWATAPSAVYVFSPEGKRLGTITPPEDPANCAWGDDGRSLYITAETGVYRLRTLVMGQRVVYA